jgi:protein TonB
MRRRRLFAAAMVLIVGVAQPMAMFGQDDPAKESYDGVPMCRNARGVFPRSTYRPDPEYDDKARKKKIQGVVTLSAVVTTEGRTVDIKVVKSLTPGLDQQAIKSVSRWRFEPVSQDGQLCPMRVNVQVQFRLY